MIKDGKAYCEQSAVSRVIIHNKYTKTQIHKYTKTQIQGLRMVRPFLSKVLSQG